MQDSTKNVALSDESLTFSVTPPVCQEDKPINDNSDDSISEHLTLNSGGTENDRSFQEIEISCQPSLLLNITALEDAVNKSQEQSAAVEPNLSDSEDDELGLNSDEGRSTSNEGPKRICSILEEILCNDQFQSGQNTSIDNSKEESFNIFGDINLGDCGISNFKNDLSLNEKNLYASDFQLPILKDGHEIERRIRDFEELIAVKDSTIAALTSELDSVREGSNTNTGSTLSTTEYRQLQEECHNKVKLLLIFGHCLNY